MKNNPDRIRFLSVPESLRGRISGDSGFFIDPAVPIPVEIPEGGESLNIEELSLEMIAAGMLRVIQTGIMPERHDYYRGFVLALRPDIFGEFTEAAILKARNGDFDSALDILGILQGLFPLSPVTLLNRALVLEQRARLFYRRGRKEAEAEFQAAGAAYEKALALQPPFPGAFFNAGFFYMEQKNYRLSLECFSQYLELAGEDEKKEQALLLMREIKEHALDDESFTEACELITEGREVEGLECARDFIERHPAVWNGWFMLGWALRRLERWKDGAAAFQKAVDSGGGNSDTRNELAICLMELGDYASARRELETALRDDPENTKIISNLAVLALKCGSNDEAAAFFRSVLELDPDDPLAKGYL
jgi:tetratricopeptide (TPR) repeat protein